jgi:hypothetical protein
VLSFAGHMSTASTSGRINTILFALFAVVALLFIWFWISNPTRSVGETSGTVEAITVQPSTDSHVGPDRTAMIRLGDGTLVQAKVVTPINVHSGQRAKLVIAEQLLSGTRTYEVVEAAETR